MHNNYFFFRHLTPALENKLRNTVISECFSQSKDELVLRFETLHEPVFIKVSVSPAFSCIAFPSTFHRAKKNSADLFGELIGRRVLSIRQFANERSFALQLSDHYSLLFKMHGNRSNIILFNPENAEVLFKNSIRGDSELTLSALDRQIDWTFETFIRHRNELPKVYFTFGKTVWQYLSNRQFNALNVDEQWKEIQVLLAQFSSPEYFICEAYGKIVFSLMPIEKVVRKFQEPLQAITEFFNYYVQQNALITERSAALSQLRSALHGAEQYRNKAREKLSKLDTEKNYRAWADLIMANLHTIKPGKESATVDDFYNENVPIEIKLKKELSPQKNAELYYSKSKKQHLETNRLHEALTSKEEAITQLKNRLLEIEGISDLKTLRSRVESWGLQLKNEPSEETVPYHTVEFHGFRILIGKNAQSNDKLTLLYSYKEDLWLHAKDVAGSHVLIKYQSGKKFPKDVIERAAQLAAYYSKRKTDTLCPVIVTPRKFVRKRKGDPAGAVVVEREDVMMVVPQKEGGNNR